MTSATDELRKSLDFMRIWISEDAHLGESAISRELEKAEGLRKLDAIEQAIAATIGSEVNGETSDGYHTFNELYHHRAVLFSVIVRDHRDIAWKASKHHDGTMYDGMFIVGVETPSGQATYHYDLDPYWDMFDCEEREFAPEWDGHTPDEAIARIATLGRGTCKPTEDDCCPCCGEDLVKCNVGIGELGGAVELDPPIYHNYCPNCGRKVIA